MRAFRFLLIHLKRLKLLPSLRIICLILNFVALISAEDCNNGKGECKMITDCPPIAENFEILSRRNQITFCMGEDTRICCPKPPAPRVGPKSGDNRIFVMKCTEYNRTAPCGTPTTPLVVNGVEAEPKEFPHMALLGEKRANSKPHWICGATLISKKFVATAAHCLPNYKPEDLIVRLGELDHSRDNDDAQPEDFNLVNIVPHPNYDLEQFDIAVLELERETKFSVYIKPACLPWSNSDEYDKFLATGWGSTGNAKDYSSHLLKVTLTPFDANACQNVREDAVFNSDTEICAGSKNDTSDTCYGDSGGPLFVKHPVYSCMYVLVGITSKGQACGRINSPAVYTRVHLFVNWIQQIVWDSRPDFG